MNNTQRSWYKGGYSQPPCCHQCGGCHYSEDCQMVDLNQTLVCAGCGGFHYCDECQTWNPYSCLGENVVNMTRSYVYQEEQGEENHSMNQGAVERKSEWLERMEAKLEKLNRMIYDKEEVIAKEEDESGILCTRNEENKKSQGSYRNVTVDGQKETVDGHPLWNAQKDRPSTVKIQPSTVMALGSDVLTSRSSIPPSDEHDIQFSNFLDIFKKLHTNMPFIDSLLQMLKYANFLKQFLAHKENIEELETVALTAECSAIMQKNEPRKSGDPGSFSIPCTIGNVTFDRALCDLGSSINLMPSSICRKLGLGDCNPTKVTLQMADRSIRYPRGIIENVLVKVDKLVFPVDFVILDMEEDENVPIILGRPFLATGRASIDVAEGKLSLRIGDDEVSFNMYNSPNSTNEVDACSSFKQEESSKQDLSMLGGVDLGLEEKQGRSISLPSKSVPPCKEKNPNCSPSGTIHSLTGSTERGNSQATTGNLSKETALQLKEAIEWQTWIKSNYRVTMEDIFEEEQTEEEQGEENSISLGETFLGSIFQEHEKEETVSTSCFAFSSNSHDSRKKTKAWYKNKEAMKKEFPKDAKVMLRNDTRWKFFPGKKKEEWSGPFTVCKVVATGAIKIKDSERKFLMTGQRLKLCDDGGGFSSHTIPFGT